MKRNSSYPGSVPEKYDRYLGPLLFEPFAEDLATRIGAGLSQTPVLQDVLEIACGTGRLTRHLRRVLPPATRLESLDLNPHMIAIAKRQVQDAQIQWGISDAQDLPYEDASFDLVVSQFGIMFIPDKAKAFTGFHRVLRPGGRLHFNTWNTIASNEVVYKASEIIDRFFPDRPPAFYRSPFSFHDEDQIRSLVRAAGFSDIRMELRKMTGFSPTAAEAATGLVEGSPVIGFIIENAPELLFRIRESVEKEIAARFGEKPLQSPLEAWVAEARKK
ncbi:MAG: class I SAM-dependent methyltransferase [Puia sp.]|nr:class I SAM-dependent methyltransferase [Puia sp.]